MAPGSLLDRRVRPRRDEEVEHETDSSNALDSDRSDLDIDNDGETLSGAVERDSLSQSDEDETLEPENTDLKSISFADLAQAQAALDSPSRKRKRSDIEPSSVNTSSDKTTTKNDHGLRLAKEHPSRTSKHAPAVQSSRRAVSRRLEVFEANPGLKSRDPRFDPLIQSSTAASSHDPNASERANRNYAFITDYQASEILALKSQIKKKSTAPEEVAALKRQLMSLEAKMRRADTLSREREILRQHKREEREAIRTGAKDRPYYLKRSDVKREVLAQRFEGMSKKEREKALMRKRKRVKGKESRDMPRVRRER